MNKFVGQDLMLNFDYTVSKQENFIMFSMSYDIGRLEQSIPIFSYSDPQDVSVPFIPVLFSDVMFVLFVPTATFDIYKSIYSLLSGPMKDAKSIASAIAFVAEQNILTTSCIRPQLINETSYYVLLVRSRGINKSKFGNLRNTALQYRTSLRNIPAHGQRK